LEQNGAGCVAFSPLAQGLLSDKYLKGIPADSRAASGRGNGALESGRITEDKIKQVRQLNEIAQQRGQNLAQMALSWILKDPRITSVILGVSKPEQLSDSLKCLENTVFDVEELQKINQILG
jgi:L-glyceraldehyde 3-phosphate reductase